MVVVEIKTDTGEIKHVYVDGYLYKNLEKYVIGKLTKTDDDCVFIVDGPERSGKSTLAQQIALVVDPTFNLNRICMTPDEFQHAIETAEKGQCIIYDEAYTGLASRRALSQINHIITSQMMLMGMKNLVVIIVLPTFFMLDKYVALFRARGLFHVYRKGIQKGFFMYFNQERKRALYLKNVKYMTYQGVRCNFRGRFLGKYVVDEKEYIEKKKRVLEKGFTDKREVYYIDQRNRFIYMIWREFAKSRRDITELCKIYGIELSTAQISTIIQELYPTLEPYAMKKKKEVLIELKRKEEIKGKLMKHRAKMKELLEKDIAEYKDGLIEEQKPNIEEQKPNETTPNEGFLTPPSPENEVFSVAHHSL